MGGPRPGALGRGGAGRRYSTPAMHPCPPRPAPNSSDPPLVAVARDLEPPGPCVACPTCSLRTPRSWERLCVKHRRRRRGRDSQGQDLCAEGPLSNSHPPTIPFRSGPGQGIASRTTQTSAHTRGLLSVCPTLRGGMGERAHARQPQQRGWPGQPAPSLPGARATPAQPASGGGCLPQPRWAVCATAAGAHQGQTSCEGEKDMVDGPDSVWRNRAPGPHAHRNTTRQATDGLWTEARGQVKRPRQQPAHPQYANYWAPLTRKRHTMPHSAQPQHTDYWAPRTRKRHQREHRPQRPTESSDPTQQAKGRTGDCPGPCKGATTRRNVTQGGSGVGAVCQNL